MWFSKILVRFFMALDTTLFNFISTLYDLLMDISRTSILSQGDIAKFAQRIELLLGIFMLFKLSFSLITYIVNPDDFTEKEKGFGKLIQNSVISLGLLVLVPYIFQMAFNLQAKILEGNVLAKLILGDELRSASSCPDGYKYDSTTNNCINDDNETVKPYDTTIMDDAGNMMAFQVMLPFFSPRYAVEELTSCINMRDENGKFSEECYDAMSGLLDDENNVDINNYKYGIENQSLGLTFRINTALLTAKDDGDEYFIIDYKFLLSTAVAVVVCLLLITFCIDIGVRSVKLAFLQLIYPIPVISYMDPKSGKDGLFTKWYKMCLSTYLSLFIRLLALYFGIYIISTVAHSGMYDVINGSQITNGWVQIFVIIGILMFVKQMPKILENLGIKLDGDGKFSLNPLRKLEQGLPGGQHMKKFNDMVGKVPLAPLHGAQTFGKKMIGGIDAARHGKGFSQGFRRTHGNLYNAYHKKLDEWAPDTAEARKNERLAREQLHMDEMKMSKGKKYFDKVKSIKEKNPNANVSDLFSNSAYKASFAEADEAKKNMYNAKNNAQLVASRLGQVKSVDDLNKTDQNKFMNTMSEADKSSYNSLKAKIETYKQNQADGDYSIQTQQALDEATKEINELTSSSLVKWVDKEVSNANAEAGKREKIYEMKKNHHEQNKKIYTTDAQIEDAYDYYDKTH